MAEDMANSIGEFLHAAMLSVAPWVFEVHWITWVLLSPVLFLAYAMFAGKRSNSKFKRACRKNCRVNHAFRFGC